jgi:hypothetical protein
LNRQTSLFVGSHRVQQPFFWPTQPHSNLSVDFSLCCVHDFIQSVDFPCFVLVMICAKKPGRTRVCLCLGRRLLVCIHAHTSTRPSLCGTPSTPSRTVPVCVLPEGMWDWSLASILSSQLFRHCRFLRTASLWCSGLRLEKGGHLRMVEGVSNANFFAIVGC